MGSRRVLREDFASLPDYVAQCRRMSWFIALNTVPLVSLLRARQRTQRLNLHNAVVDEGRAARDQRLARILLQLIYVQTCMHR